MFDRKYIEDTEYIEDYKQDFARRLRVVMTLRNVTRNELSRLTGISTVTLSNYRNGKSLPSAANAVKLSNALRWSLDEILGNK